MAKSQDTKTNDTSTTESTKETKKYKVRSISVEEQKKMSSESMDKLRIFKDWKKMACYYDPKRKDIDSRYQRDDEMFLMFKKSIEGSWSNVASPIFYRAMQQLVAEFSDADIKTKFKPQVEKDAHRVKALEVVNANWEKVNKVREVDDITFERMVSHGKAVEMIEWERLSHKVHKIKKNVQEKDAMTDEEFERLVQLNEIPYKLVDHIDKNDVVRRPILMASFFPEPGSKSCQGTFKAMNECFLEEWISLEDALRELNSDPLVIKKNIKLVKGTGGNKTTDEFDSKQENENAGLEGQVLRLKHFNVANDEVRTYYDGNLLKVYYLPFGRLPFIDYSYCQFNDHFFVPGLAAFLDPITREHETIKNALIDEQKIRINPPTYVDSMMFEDVQDGNQFLTPGKLIEVEGLSESQNAIVPHPTSNLRSTEIFQMMGILDNHGVEISGVNQKRSGSLQGVGSATEMSVMDQGTAKIIRRVVNNYFNGRVQATSLACKYFFQEYTKPLVMGINGEKLDKPKPREILLENIRIQMPQSENDKWKERRIEGYSTFVLKPDYITLEADAEPIIAQETIAKLTGAQELQKWQNALPQLMVPDIAGDPMYTPKGQPIPIVSSTKLIKNYANAAELGDIYNYDDYDVDEEIEDAKDECKRILAGENVLGVPGKCLEHIREEERVVMVVSTLLKKLGATLEPDPMLASIATSYGAPDLIPEEGSTAISRQAISQMYKALDSLIRHIEIDRMQANEPIDLRKMVAESTPKGFHLMPDGSLMSETEMMATQQLQPPMMPPNPMAAMGGTDPNMAQIPGGTMPMPSGGSPIASQGSVVPMATQFDNGM
jgi:hypothetical protein